MDEIWQDCALFLRDVLTNPLPHRQILPTLLEFAAIIGQKVDNTNFGEQRKIRRELAVRSSFAKLHPPLNPLLGQFCPDLDSDLHDSLYELLAGLPSRSR